MHLLVALLSAVYILFLPGFFVSLIFFPFRKIDFIERFALSFAFSIAIIPPMVFYTNLLGVRITMVSVILQVYGIIAISSIVLIIKYWRSRR